MKFQKSQMNSAMGIKPEVTVTFPNKWLQSLNVFLHRTRTLTPRPHIAGWVRSCFLWGPWQGSHWLQRQSIMPNTGRHYFWRAVFLETADICMLDYTDKTKHLFTCDLSWCIWRGLHLYSPLGANFNLSMGLWQIFMDNIYFTKDKDLQYQAVIPGQIFLSCYSPRSHPR